MKFYFLSKKCSKNQSPTIHRIFKKLNGFKLTHCNNLDLRSHLYISSKIDSIEYDSGFLPKENIYLIDYGICPRPKRSKFIKTIDYGIIKDKI